MLFGLMPQTIATNPVNTVQPVALIIPIGPPVFNADSALRYAFIIVSMHFDLQPPGSELVSPQINGGKSF